VGCPQISSVNRKSAKSAIFALGHQRNFRICYLRINHYKFTDFCDLRTGTPKKFADLQLRNENLRICALRTNKNICMHTFIEYLLNCRYSQRALYLRSTEMRWFGERRGGRYDNLIHTRFLAPKDCSKIPSLFVQPPLYETYTPEHNTPVCTSVQFSIRPLLPEILTPDCPLFAVRRVQLW
jgi:hypothetical protein